MQGVAVTAVAGLPGEVSLGQSRNHSQYQRLKKKNLLDVAMVLSICVSDKLQVSAADLPRR